jgi:hypothetical protein
MLLVEEQGNTPLAEGRWYSRPRERNSSRHASEKGSVRYRGRTKKDATASASETQNPGRNQQVRRNKPIYTVAE